MSYNIDTFNLKEIKDLKIPVSALFMARADWHPERTANEDGTVTFEVFDDDSAIRGTVSVAGTEEILTVMSFSCCGEGSGHAMYDVFLPAFKRSTGTLTASCVWEGGDSINRLEVRDGKVTWVDIEI